MIPRNKLTTTHMSSIETVACYLIKITKLTNQLAVIKMKVEDEKWVPIALNEFFVDW